MFQTIEENVTSELTEKKSRFIAHVFYVESVQEAEEIIKQMNKKYYDARHNCYAFSVCTENGIVNRFSDDGEPSGTAGAPMLNVLTSQNLSNILVIVTRYFGGILLGTGGLVKAYTTATIEAINNAKIVTKERGLEIKIVVNYADLEKLKYYFKQNQIEITNLEYEENVSVTAEFMNNQLEQIKLQKQNLNFEILKMEIIREKFVKCENNIG